jgi:hypothetical protein
MKNMTDCGDLFSDIEATQIQIFGDRQALDDLGTCHTPTCEARRERLNNDIDQATASLQQLEQQVTPICNLLIGPWQVDANGSEGQLTLEHVDSITGQSLSGQMALSDQAGSPPDNIQGSWDDVAKVIVFTRSNPDPTVTVTQTFTGFLGDNHADRFVILAGSFTESDIPPGTPRSQFGWFARK